MPQIDYRLPGGCRGAEGTGNLPESEDCLQAELHIFAMCVNTVVMNKH